MIFITKSFRTIVFVFIIFFHNVSTAVSSGLPRVSPVYLGIEMIQPSKSSFKVRKKMMNHFYAQINRGHPRKAGGYSGRNVVKKAIKTKTIWQLHGFTRCLRRLLCIRPSGNSSFGNPRSCPSLHFVHGLRRFVCAYATISPILIVLCLI